MSRLDRGVDVGGGDTGGIHRAALSVHAHDGIGASAVTGGRVSEKPVPVDKRHDRAAVEAHAHEIGLRRNVRWIDGTGLDRAAVNDVEERGVAERDVLAAHDKRPQPHEAESDTARRGRDAAEEIAHKHTTSLSSIILHISSVVYYYF